MQHSFSRKWRCDNATCTNVFNDPQARLSPRTEQREQEQESEEKKKSNNNNNNNNHDDDDDDDDDDGITNKWRANGGTKRQVKHTHQLQCQLNFKKQTKTKTVIRNHVWQYKKELTHLNIKNIIAITTWTKMGAHSKSWIMTHDA